MTKKEIERIRVEERKKMREKHAQSDFMRLSLQKFNMLETRAAEKGVTLAFDRDQFRAWMRPKVDGPCYYCGKKVTLSKFTPDHAMPVFWYGKPQAAGIDIFALDNLVPACRPCNDQKGLMREEAFRTLLAHLPEFLHPEEIADLKSRLAIGGKWKAKKF